MINGVIEIVAAVLFTVIFLSTERNIIWLWVAGFYLVCGGVNLVIHTIQNRRKLNAAQKQAKQNAVQKEEPVKVPAKAAEPALTAPDASFQVLTEEEEP